MNSNDMRTRSLGGTLLVIKGLNDCVTIERGTDSKPRIVSIEGLWDREELREARSLWKGSDAQRR